MAAPAEPAADDDVADEEDDEALVHSSSEDAGSEHSVESEAAPAAAPPAAPAGRGRGRGRARGGGARGRGRGRAGAAAGDAAGDAEAAAEKPSKYPWVDAASHTFTPRYEWDGEELPWLDGTFDGLTSKSSPAEWFAKVDAPDKEYEMRAANSEKYRSYRFLHDLDGPSKKCYDGAGEMQVADMRMMDAFLLLGGLDPAVSRDKIFESNRLELER